MRGLVISLNFLALVLASCSRPGQAPPAISTPPPLATQVFPVIPTPDLTKHSVPLDRIYFDTFQPLNRAVPLSEASPDLIQRLQDAIPPIYQPQFQRAEEATWMGQEDLVIGYTAGEIAWAFPLRLLNFHEIVNAVLEGEPVLISYCPLCYSAVIYDRRLDGQTLIFGNTSALYESDLVMVDHQTGSYWWQVAGQAIVGPLTGQRLRPLPSLTMTWGRWQELHPASLLLARPSGSGINYASDPFSSYEAFLQAGRFAFPVSEAALDERLPPAAKVLAVALGDLVRAYPMELDKPAALMDRLAGQDLVVFIDPAAQSGAVFIPQVVDRNLSFEARELAFYDLETASRWTLRGEAVEGPLAGARLTPVPSLTSYWFALVAAHPQVTIYAIP